MTGGGGPVPHAADQSEKRKPGRTQPTDWPALEAALDANAARIASLNVSVTLAAGKPPTSEELVLAAAAREGLASVLGRGIRTADVAGASARVVGTRDFGAAVCDELRRGGQ